MESPNLLMGRDSAPVAGPADGRSPLSGSAAADRQGSDTSPFQGLVDLEIEHTIQDQEKEADDHRWEEWVPEIHEALKDRALSIIADRFKVEYMAKKLAAAGCNDPKDIIKFIVESTPGAQMMYPKYFPMDALYKAMRDGTIRTAV